MRRAFAIVACIASGIGASMTVAFAACSPYEEADSTPEPPPRDAGASDGSSSNGDGDSSGGSASKRLFVFGGNVNAIASLREKEAYAATILADGSLGAWDRVPELDIERNNAAVVATSDAVVLLGGMTASQTYETSVTVAPLAPPGAWFAAPTLAGAHTSGAGSFADGRIYVSGGFTPTGVSSTIESAEISGTGVTPFKNAGTLPSEMTGHVQFVFASRFYTAGGLRPVDGGTVATAQTNWKKIATDGTIEPTVYETGSLPEALWGQRAVVVGSRVFVLGGADSGGSTAARSSVAVAAPTAATGALTWSVSTPMPAGALWPCAVVSGDTIYVLGGFSANSGDPTFVASDQVAIGRVGSNGALLWTASAPMPKKRAASGCAVR